MLYYIKCFIKFKKTLKTTFPSFSAFIFLLIIRISAILVLSLSHQVECRVLMIDYMYKLTHWHLATCTGCNWGMLHQQVMVTLIIYQAYNSPPYHHYSRYRNTCLNVHVSQICRFHISMTQQIYQKCLHFVNSEPYVKVTFLLILGDLESLWRHQEGVFCYVVTKVLISGRNSRGQSRSKTYGIGSVQDFMHIILPGPCILYMLKQKVYIPGDSVYQGFINLL